MSKVVVSLFENGEYMVFYGGHREANTEMGIIHSANYKEGKLYHREVTRIEVEQSDLVFWDRTIDD